MPKNQKIFRDGYEFTFRDENVYKMINGVDDDPDDSAFFRDEEDESIFEYFTRVTPITLGNLQGKYIVYQDKKDSYAEYKFLLPNRHMMTVLITARRRKDIKDILAWPEIAAFLNSFEYKP